MRPNCLVPSQPVGHWRPRTNDDGESRREVSETDSAFRLAELRSLSNFRILGVPGSTTEASRGETLWAERPSGPSLCRESVRRLWL
jgi:hypothetical protein